MQQKNKKTIRYAYFLMDAHILCRLNARTLDCDTVEFWSKEEGWHSDEFLAALFGCDGNIVSASEEQLKRYLEEPQSDQHTD